MDMVAEIISRVERRRQWSPEQKVKILTEGKRRPITTLRIPCGSRLVFANACE
jgi:hypothetical protein